jgi:hypothetical protein
MDTSEFNPSVRRKIIPFQLGKVYIPPNYMIPRIWRDPDYRKDVLYQCSTHVATLASLTERQAKDIVSASKAKPLTRYPRVCKSYFDIEKVVAAFDYPLKKKCVLVVKPTLDFGGNPMVMHIGYFLWQLAKAYQDEVYVHPQKYGVWGHSLDDLWFETIILKKISPHRYYGVMELGS